MPKRLRYFFQRDTALQGRVLRIFLSVVERCLREHSPGCSASARIGAVAFIHRFGLSQWPLFSDKPTLNIDASQHRIGMALVTTQEA